MTPRSAFIAALWFSALLMQSVGLLHGYVHPHGGHAARHVLACPVDSTQPAACMGHPGHATTVGAETASHATDWLHVLFAGHDGGSSGCSLFDSLTHADLLHDAPTAPLAYAAPTHPDAVHAAWHHATQVTGFLARAPPAIG